MKLKGKTIKEFFSSPVGVFIDKEDMIIFIDFEQKKSKIIVKPKDQRNNDDKKIIFSNAFESVKVLNDEEMYDVDVVFDAIMFTHKNKEEKIDVELAILGERY